MKPSIPFRFLIRSSDGIWTQTSCRDIREVQRIWSARMDAAGDAGILCSGLNDVAPSTFDSVAKRNAGRLLLSGGMKSYLPPSFEISADPVATVDGIQLFAGLRGFGNTIEDPDAAEAVSEAPDDLERPTDLQQGWLGDFVRENPIAADNLSRHGIRDDDSYLAGESELEEDLRRSLGCFRAHSLAGADNPDPCLFAGAAPPWLRERELTDLTVSAKTADLFKAKGIRTVDDLANRSMSELMSVQNLGRASLADVLQGLAAALEEGPAAIARRLQRRASWFAAFLGENPDTAETLSRHDIRDENSYRARESELPSDLRRRLGVFRAHRLIGDNSEDPCELARAAPAWLQERQFVSIFLPVRAEKRIRMKNIATVGDLASCHSGDLLQLSGFGMGSLRDLFRAIDDALNEGPLATGGGAVAGEADGLLGQFRRSLAKLSPRDREILTRRVGFERDAETLQQLSDDLGMTRERIRQIASAAIRKSRPPNDWHKTLAAKVAAKRKDGKEPLTVSGMERDDLWFKGVSSHGRFCENLVKTIFKGSLRVIEIEGVRYVGSMGQAEWNSMVSSTGQALGASTGKRWSETAVRDFVGKRLPPEAREFAETLWRTLSPRCHFATLPGGERVFAGFGDSVTQLVRKILAESDRPLHLAKVIEMARMIEKREEGKELDSLTIKRAATAAGLLFGRGIYGLRDHLHLSDEQAAGIRDVAESIILSQPERQWHASEILSELQRHSPGDNENLDKYKVDIVLASSKKLTALGRMTWIATGRKQRRIDIRREVIAILEEAGGPLDAEEIQERLRRKRGLNEKSGIQAVSPLVRLGNGLWGINDRDVPVKRERQQELIEILAGRLEAQRQGIHESELHEFLDLGDCPLKVFASIAAQDSRLKRNKEGYMYLAKWGNARRYSTRDALLQILNEAGEPPTFKVMVERVESIVGRKCNRQSISSALRALRASIRE